MPAGKISENNDRLLCILPKELKKEFSEVAKTEHHSMSSLAAQLIENYVSLSKNYSNISAYKKLIHDSKNNVQGDSE